MSETSDRFWKLCHEADEAFQGAGDVRQSLARVLDLIQTLPESRREFIQCFAELLRGRGPWEVCYFCMRHLRWPEVYDMATELLIENDDFRVKNVMSHIRDAYAERRVDDYLY